MKIAEILSTQTQKKKFSVSKEKLSEVWDLISKVYSEKIVLEPGCDKCDNGRIKEVSEFGYTTRICTCVDIVDTVTRLALELEAGGVTPEIIEKYKLADYTNGMFSLEETIQLLNKDGWLYAHGDVGTGKTYFAFICLYLALSAGYSVQYANVPKLLDMLRPSEAKNDSLIDELCEVDFLILDDIGQEKVSTWTQERLYIIINERYIQNKKTVITSNCQLSKLLEKTQHKAMVSRIVGQSTVVNFIGTDKRK